MLRKILKNTSTSLLLFGAFFLAPNYSMASEDVYSLELNRKGAALVSDVVLTDDPFNSIIVRVGHELDGLMVDFGRGFEPVHGHSHLEDHPHGHTHSHSHDHAHDHSHDDHAIDPLIFTEPTQQMQFLFWSADELDSLSLEIEIMQTEVEERVDNIDDLLVSNSALVAQGPRIISRKDWGADEQLRIWNPTWDDDFDDTVSRPNPCADIERDYAHDFAIESTQTHTADGQALIWPITRTKKLDKFVVHHTDSEIRDLNGDSLTDARDYRAMVRAIYKYHTVSRGWGDIGYNYLIDPLGNIYEGRAGGDKTIGAHALCFNHGTMGIAVIGNYENNKISDPALNALIQLIGQKAKKFNINPQETTNFRGKRLGNIFGHREVRPTTCPGNSLFEQFEHIRDRAALSSRTFSESSLATAELDYNAELIGFVERQALDPGRRKQLTLKFENTGTKTWDETTWMHVALNNDTNARVVPAVEGKSFVAADLNEDSVAPGRTGTFTIELEAGFNPGSYGFSVSPVINQRFKISRASTYIPFSVNDPDYDYEVVSHEFPSGKVFQGQELVATLRLKNTGNVTWRNYGNSPIALGASSPQDRASVFIKENPFRLGYMLQSEVAPGEFADFVMNLSIPEDREGEVIERFTPVIEGVRWLDDKALGFKVQVKEPVHLAKTTKLERLGFLRPGERKYVRVQMENQGDLRWKPDNVEANLLGRGIKVFTRKLKLRESVDPGDSTELGFWVEAPLESGQHTVTLSTRYNNTAIRGANTNFVVEVPEPRLRAVKIDQSQAFAEVSPGDEIELSVSFKNTGNTVWKKKGSHAVHLGTALPNDRESSLYIKGNWINPARVAELEEEEVLPGDTGTFKFLVSSRYRRRYEENFQLVMEDYGWINGGNVKWIVDVKDGAVAPVSDSKPTTSQTTNQPPVDIRLRASTSSPTSNQAAPSTTRPSPITLANIQPITRISTKALRFLAPTPPAASVAPVSEEVFESFEVPILDERPFRVRLSHESSDPHFTADIPYVVLNGDDQLLFNVGATKKVFLRLVNNSFEINFGSQKKRADVVRIVPKDSEGIVEITNMERRPSWNESLNDNRFRGIVEVRMVDGEVAFINELPLEDYMRGLAEVSNSAHPEKQKTIAVLARTYARFYMSDENRKFPGLPYDGNDDPAVFQRYLGYGVEARSPNFVDAVEATEDVVVTYEGELVKTPYFNQSDGRTKSAEEIWGWTNTPYLLSVPDPWSEGLEQRGHGVGLSGHGATEQAKVGKRFDQIIKYYYTGVDIEKLSF